MNNLEDILTTPGVDGVYICPNDLALVLGARPGGDLTDQRCIGTTGHILAGANAHGKFAGIDCASGKLGAIQCQQSFDMVTLTHEGSCVSQAAKAHIATALAPPSVSGNAISFTSY